MASILEQLAKGLPKTLQPMAKALIPALATVLALIVQFAASGQFDQAQMVTAITGLGAALLAFLTTNPSPYVDDDDELPDDGGLESFAANLETPGEPGPEPTVVFEPNGDGELDLEEDGEFAFDNGPRG